MLVGRTGLSPVMVGRTAELDRLTGLVAARPAPSVALVEGEAGIGKTRLVQEMVRRLPGDTLVLAGQADPGTVGRPMELVVDALAGALAQGPPADREERHGELVAVVRDADRPSDERVRAGVALVRLLGEGTSTVVVFEDLHWADSESVAVFERLAEPDREPAAGSSFPGLLLVGTYRPDALSRRQPAAEALLRLDRRHTVTHLHLDRLRPADVRDLVAAVTDEEPSFRTVDALHTRTGGNPFFLEELMAASRAAPGGDADVELPWTVAEVVRGEIDDLAPDVREMVNAAAVLGRRVGFDLLAAVTGASEADLIARLRVVIDRGLMVESDPDVFSFHHELAREAIEGGLLGRERRRLHEAALSALLGAESRDHIALAHHARGAGRFDDLVAEARLGARSSLAHGSSYQALQLAEMGLAEAPDDAELLALATRSAWLADLMDEAEAHAARWLAVARRTDDVGAEADALAFRMRVAFERGHRDAMVELTSALVELIDRLPTDEQRAQAMAAVAQSNMLRDQAEATYLWADKALALAEARDLPSVRLAALVEKGSMMMSDPARWDEARELMETITAEAEEAGDHVLAARGLNNLVWHARRWSDAHEVRGLIERMRAHAEAAGYNVMSVLDVAATQAQLAGAEGDLDGAIAHIDGAARSGSPGGGRTLPAWLAIFRAGLALEAGDLDDAARFTEMAKPATTRTAGAITGLDLNLAARRGDLASARARLADLLLVADADEHASASQAHDILGAGLPAGLTVDELRPLVDRVGHYAGHRLDPDSGWRHLIDAQLAEAAGDVDEAIARYGAAAETLGEKADLLAGVRATTHVGVAANLVRAERFDEAGPHVAAAARLLDRWRGWRVDALRAVERRLGRGDAPAGPDALTPREREVVALLAEGLTNAQLAERLYISPRTAAVHVSNVLTKLDMTSRTEVAAWAVRTGATGDGAR